MGKRRKVKAINGEFQLPEPIIQHIQSFLTAKQAAQTTALSKSWRKAWLTRPNLDFDDSHFPKKQYGGKTDEFSEFVKKTIKRYEESNLKIEHFRLIMQRCSWEHDRVFTNELIVKALKMGATHISLRINDSDFVLPGDVFGAEKLVGLSVEGCTIDLEQVEEDPTVIRCSRLKSLSLRRMSGIKRIDTISNIISSFPLIEYLSLSWIDAKPDASGRHLNLDKLYNLKCLVILGVEIDPLFLGDLSSKLPSLKDLTVQRCDFQEDILISSRSLERLSFGQEHAERRCRTPRKRFKFDVPSLRTFAYDGSSIPSVSFMSTFREYHRESHVSIDHHNRSLSTLWFRKLNKFLTKLSPSKIHLSLDVFSNLSFNYEVIDGLRKPHEVESLRVVGHLPSLTSYALFDGLFRFCRPKIITQDLSDDFFRKALVRGMDEKRAMQGHCLYGMHDVEEVNVQLFDEVDDVWQDLPWKTFLDASASQVKKMRFQLKWKP